MCGRLRCCLVYEYEQYVEARRMLPRRSKQVGTPHGEGRVITQLPLKDAVLVDVGDGIRKIVERQDIIPLEEFRKLAEKAKAPCDKHGDGACDCGQPAGQRQADIIAARQTPAPAEKSETEKSSRKPPRRPRSDGRNQKRSRGRRRGRRTERKAETKDSPNQQRKTDERND